jgi:diguanylate cyclase (GGDEF)-like protein
MRAVQLGLMAFALALAGPAAASHATNSGSYQAGSLDDRVDLLVRDGFERPIRALLALEQLKRETPASAASDRLFLQAAGSIEAENGNAVRAAALAEQLLARSADEPGGRMVAASNLVRALAAETAGQQDVAAALAQSALPAFMAGCPGTPAAAAPTSPTADMACDYRSAWRALRILERRANSLGVKVTATAHAQAAYVLAERAGDPYRQVLNLSALAVAAKRRGEPDLARELMTQAKRLSSHGGSLALQAHISNAEALVAGSPRDPKAALHWLEEALSLATQASAPRLEAQILSNLTDVYGQLGRPADALRAAERAMPIVREHHDLRAERVLINNAGTAKIGLGRIGEGKQDLARVLELWQRSGETAGQAETLAEFGEALGAAGDARGALELYHRERALSAELMNANRVVALRELRSRNDADAHQRDIELLARDNLLKTEAIANRDLTQRIWWLLAAVMVLAIALVALLYFRVRETHKRLAINHDQLRVQSERDPLTNLANRRHFQDVMARQAGESADGGFEGALLLVDIDHFKHINDAHGHGAGDQVLVEVARRLNDAVRRDDLIVRWGGEEFLILAPRAAPEQAEQIAERVLRSLGQTPVSLGGVALRVTASIGYARFPLPPYNTAVAWEQAINLADMALYTAKNQGRNRAFGITSTTAATRTALRDVEADFDRAWHEGRVTLAQSVGPEPFGALRAA